MIKRTLRSILIAPVFFLLINSVSAYNSTSGFAVTGFLVSAADSLASQQKSITEQKPGRQSRSLPEKEPPPRYVEITRGPVVGVYKEMNPKSPVFERMARQGERFRLLYDGVSWYQIIYQDSVGWIEKRYAKIYQQTKVDSIKEKLPFIGLLTLIGGILAFVILLLFIILAGKSLVRKMKQGSSVKEQLGKSCLIVGDSAKEVSDAFTNEKKTLEKCFTETGLEVVKAHEFNVAQNILFQSVPDIMLVDWHDSPNIHQAVERVFSHQVSLAKVLVIFYNVEDPITQPKSTIIPQVHYLGAKFTDRDIFKVVTPIILAHHEATATNHSTESRAMEGAVSAGNLSELMQFIEIGAKTGCLLIEHNRRPHGMVFFENGAITFADTGSLKGKEAVLHILSLQAGRFHFILNKKPQSTNVTAPTISLLMEWAQAKDEASRD
ncbi:MAG: DUF4388 domain-containing protein [Chitinivibrionales bacterium]|nr:DUF4388 domain-containing protein [Chitinivibrionales bacterium]